MHYWMVEARQLKAGRWRIYEGRDLNIVRDPQTGAIVTFDSLDAAQLLVVAAASGRSPAPGGGQVREVRRLLWCCDGLEILRRTLLPPHAYPAGGRGSATALSHYTKRLSPGKDAIDTLSSVTDKVHRVSAGVTASGDFGGGIAVQATVTIRW